MLLELHFAEHALALEFLLERAKRLVDIVVANADLHVVSPPFRVEVAFSAGSGAIAKAN
jgi:hypothetical protein